MSELPPVMKPHELAPVIRTTVAALAQDRYRRVGIPYVKLGRRVRYMRADVAGHLAANRTPVQPVSQRRGVITVHAEGLPLIAHCVRAAIRRSPQGV